MASGLASGKSWPQSSGSVSLKQSCTRHDTFSGLRRGYYHLIGTVSPGQRAKSEVRPCYMPPGEMQEDVQVTRQMCVRFLRSSASCTPCGSRAAVAPAARLANGCCPEPPPGGPAGQCPTPLETAGTSLQQHALVIAYRCRAPNGTLHHLETPLSTTLQPFGSSGTVPGHTQVRMHRASKGSGCPAEFSRNDCTDVGLGSYLAPLQRCSRPPTCRLQGHTRESPAAALARGTSAWPRCACKRLPCQAGHRAGAPGPGPPP